ncbi:MAG: hypothetical protein QOG52_849 [Frankiaceae bacterium]|nr:hypothetical protein [Frankiaceae bacterium]
MGFDNQPRSTPPALTLSPLAQAVSTARHYVRDLLPALGGEGCLDNAQLAVSELVTNATLHARTAMTIEVLRAPSGRIRISVRDDSPMIPQPRSYSRTATTGRGLRLVEAVCTAWGVDGLAKGAGIGKVVWCEPALDSAVPRPNDEWGDVIQEMA